MDEIAVSKFKATCLEVLKRVQKTKRPVRITRFGEPLAEVVPASPPKTRGRLLGCMAGTIRIPGDIISPASGSQDWEALRD